jgi:hypothetical protein
LGALCIEARLGFTPLALGALVLALEGIVSLRALIR